MHRRLIEKLLGVAAERVEERRRGVDPAILDRPPSGLRVVSDPCYTCNKHTPEGRIRAFSFRGVLVQAFRIIGNRGEGARARAISIPPASTMISGTYGRFGRRLQTVSKN